MNDHDAEPAGRSRRSGGRPAPRPAGAVGGALPPRRGRGAGVVRRRGPRLDEGPARADRAAEAALRLHEAVAVGARSPRSHRRRMPPGPIRRRSASPADPPSIGRYRVIRVLGEGGFGRVYLAYDSDLQREVAVKVPLAGDASRFLDVEAYLREARIVARLSHPNIVPVYDVGRTGDGRCYVVSKYMEGGDLKARLGRGRAGVRRVGGAGRRPLRRPAIHPHPGPVPPRHQAGQHPARRGGRALAGRLRAGAEGRGRGPGAGYLGTAAYMSPEQARGEGHRVDGRSDIFSIGVVLYEMLDRPAAVPRRLASGDHAAGHRRRAASAATDRRHDPRRARADLPEGDGETGVGAIHDRPRPGRRPAAFPRDGLLDGRSDRGAPPPVVALGARRRRARRRRTRARGRSGSCPRGWARSTSTTPTSSSSCCPAPGTATGCRTGCGSGRRGSRRPTRTGRSASG